MSGAAQQKKRQVTQATFDETVRENMEEFEMDRAEAVADAVKQFTSQGTQKGKSPGFGPAPTHPPQTTNSPTHTASMYPTHPLRRGPLQHLRHRGRGR